MDLNKYVHPENSKYKSYMLDPLRVEQEVVVKSIQSNTTRMEDVANMQWSGDQNFQTEEPKVVYLNEYIVKHSLVDKEKILCTMCNIEFPSTKLAKKHSKVHMSGGDFIDSANSSSKSKSDKHTTNYPSYDCSSDYLDSNSIRKSSGDKSKSPQKPKTVTCEICYKGFAQPAHLTNHLLVHTGIRNYSCQFCDKKFKQRGHVLNHQKIHLGEKSYKCSECGKCFRQTAHLRTHMKIHTGVKDHVCILCSKVFTQSGQLQTHMRTHTNERKYECHLCPMKFKQSGHLQSHLKRHEKKMSEECEEEEEHFEKNEIMEEEVEEEEEEEEEEEIEEIKEEVVEEEISDESLDA